jgi:hypothetical protein
MTRRQRQRHLLREQRELVVPGACGEVSVALVERAGRFIPRRELDQLIGVTEQFALGEWSAS